MDDKTQDAYDEVDRKVVKLSAARNYNLQCNRQGPLCNALNVCSVLAKAPEFRGRIWYDEFSARIWTNLVGALHKWDDHDDIRLLGWMQEHSGMQTVSRGTVAEGVIMYAMANRRHVVRDWLDSLTWDGAARIEMFFVDCFGALDSDYMRAASKAFLVGLVARVDQPGCQLDHVPVFEGGQGIGKSSALRALGGQWFAEAHESVTSKDFYLGLQGRWLIEIGEMDAFSRSEVTTVKRAISNPCDQFRAPYDHHVRDWPRQCAFACTTNAHDWARDDTGARRFWPVACGAEIRVDLIRENRAQLFAEARVALKAGADWWRVPDQAKEEQEARRIADPWEDIIAEWLTGKHETGVHEILADCLDVPKERRNRGHEMRAGVILRRLGWCRVDSWRGGRSVKRWFRDEEAARGSER